MRRRSGFTLIELVMTIVIAGIMASAFVGLFLPQITLFFFLPNSVRVQNAASDAMTSIIEGDRLAKGLRYAEPAQLSKVTETVGITAANGNSVTYTYYDANRNFHTAVVYLDTVTFSLQRRIDGGPAQVLSSGGAPGTGGIFIFGETDVNVPFKYYNLAGTELTGAALTPLSIYYMTIGFWANTGTGNVQQYQSRTLRRSGVKIRHFYLQNTGEWDFQFAKWAGGSKPDLIAVKKSATGLPANQPVGSRRTEIHIYNGNSSSGQMAAFAAPNIETDVALEETGDNFDFLMADCGTSGTRTPDGRLDLVAIKKSATPTGKVELHIFNGQNAGGGLFKQAYLRTAIGPVTAPTPGPSNDVMNSFEELEFQMADWKPASGNPDGVMDLFVLKHMGTVYGSTDSTVGTWQISVLDGTGNFQNYFAGAQSIKVSTDPSSMPAANQLTLQMVHWNPGTGPGQDNYIDFAVIRKRAAGGAGQTGSGMVEVYVYTGAPHPDTPNDNQSRFKGVLLLAASTVPIQAVNNADFRLTDWDNDGHPDLMWVQRNKTFSNSTEVHALSCYNSAGNVILVNGTATFNRDVLHTATVLHETSDGKSLTTT